MTQVFTVHISGYPIYLGEFNSVADAQDYGCMITWEDRGLDVPFWNIVEIDNSVTFPEHHIKSAQDFLDYWEDFMGCDFVIYELISRSTEYIITTPQNEKRFRKNYREFWEEEIDVKYIRTVRGADSILLSTQMSFK